MSIQERVAEFHAVCGEQVEYEPSEGGVALRKTLISEEYDEVMVALDEALHTGDVESLAKELADLIYVTYGTAEKFAINLDAVFNLVHESNMSKFVECTACADPGVDSCSTCSGYGLVPVLREDGKLLKGPDYQPPVLDSVLRGRAA